MSPIFPFISTILSAITLISSIILLKRNPRPYYEPKYIISKDEYLMEDHSKSCFNCSKDRFPRGNYLDNINSFIFNDKEL